VSTRNIARDLCAAVLTAGVLLSAPIDSASATAQACPDVEVVFARATGEPPGIGSVGQAFVDSLRPKVGGRSVGVYPVNYPASSSWDVPNSISAGAWDASGHVQSMATNCPSTKMVLGGMSQGAGVIDLIAIAAPVLIFTPVPMSPQVADHIAAIAVFGNPARSLPGGGPLTAISPLYGPKIIDLCAPGDPVCGAGNDPSAHAMYVYNGMVDQATTFAATRL
jgi:cutinase